MKLLMKNSLPEWAIKSIRKIRSSYKRYQKLLLKVVSRGPKGSPAVFYGYDRIPLPDEIIHGGLVKFQRMQPVYPNQPRHFNILYMVSSSLPGNWHVLANIAKVKGSKIIWNQDGVAYPAWHKGDYEKVNAPMKYMIHHADFVFYQSRFSKLSADKFLGETEKPWKILYNSVDTTVFTPAQSHDDKVLSILLGGNQYEGYRLEMALLTIAEVLKVNTAIHLYVTGNLSWDKPGIVETQVKTWINTLKLNEYVTFLGSYHQEDAPDLFKSMGILLHTKYNDPCPGIVIEAMSCGVPVVYLSSGGVGELVGDKAGIGVEVPTRWDEIVLPEPATIARAVNTIAANRQQYAGEARQRAVEKFDLQPWLEEHTQLFENLLN